jgi:lipopolysaccharide transport system permease protein
VAVLVTVSYRDVRLHAQDHAIRIELTLHNRSRQEWKRDRFFVGWQFFDPETRRFIMEGQWTPIARDTKAGESVPVELTIDFPPEAGAYQIYLSPIDEAAGWSYEKGERFLVIDAAVSDGRVQVGKSEVTTKRKLRWRSFGRAIPKIFTYPFLTLIRNRLLIRSMVRRDILARYRGSLGDVMWTMLNPLLLMGTYMFVFGVVLHARFGADRSSTGFALYFLAGMLPWLAFSEPAGRAPHVILEHRNFVKKLIFPLETLPVNQVVAGLVTEGFALAVFLIVLVILRGSLPATVLWLPALLIPQLLFTLGVCWFLAGLGVFLRDLGQIMGFVLTLWFFLTPICYPETSLPESALMILRKNPLYALVRAYRAIFLEAHAPAAASMVKLWLVAIVVFLLGHAWFYKLRKLFADVI